jgi:hypothetical protein
MAFTEQDLANQEKAFAQIVEEHDRLTGEYEAILKKQGVTEEFIKEGSLDDLPPELKAQFETAQAAAKRAGDERKAQAQWDSAPKAATSSVKRSGAIKL